MLVFFALGNAKVLSFALADAKVANASSFAFWWNIGLRFIIISRSKNTFVAWQRRESFPKCLFLLLKKQEYRYGYHASISLFFLTGTTNIHIVLEILIKKIVSNGFELIFSVHNF